MLPKDLRQSKFLLKHKDFYFELYSTGIENVYSKELAYKTMNWLCKYSGSKELIKDFEVNPNFSNYRKKRDINVFEDISYDCNFVKIMNEAAFEFIFSSIYDDKKVCDYIYYVVYYLNKEFCYDIKIFNEDQNFLFSKEFWDK